MQRQIKLLILIGLLLHSTLLLSQSSIDQNEFKALSEEIHKIVRDTKAVGVSVAVIHSYEVVWAKGFGVTSVGSNDSVTIQTLFQAITALTVMKKVQDGKISLTGNVDDQLISWHIPKSNFTDQSSVTVKQLLSHTGGVANSFYYVPGYKEGNKLPNIIECLNGTKPAENDPVKIVNTPGTKFSYSNCGYWILEALLQDSEKQEFEEIVNAEIFLPLAMTNSTFKSCPPDTIFKSVAVGHLKNNIPIDGKYYIVRPLSSGGMWSTPTDLAKFLIEMQKSRNGNSNKIIDKDNAVLMTKPVMAQYGLGFSNEIRGTGVKFFGHDGHNIGYICSMIGSLDDGFGVVVMTNSENGWKAVNKIKKIVGRKFWSF
jgi:CubicO group peptidase (beta-lactamase class C family)